MTAPTCSTCKFLDAPTTQCRRLSPCGSSVAARVLEDRKPYLAVWPIVRDFDWCGEHEPRTKP